MVELLSIKIQQFYKWCLSAMLFTFASKKPHFKIANDPQIKHEIYRFRYKVYHKEFSRKVDGHDDHSKIIKDKYDDQPNTLLFYQDKNGKIFSTIRVIIWEPGSIPKDIIEAYDIDNYPWVNSYTACEFGRLMVAKSQRKKLTGAKFITSVANFVIRQHHARTLLLSCKPHLVTSYLFFGFRPYTNNLIQYPDGLEIPLIGIIDADYLKIVNSPSKYLFSNISTIEKPHVDHLLKRSISPIVWGNAAINDINNFFKENIDCPIPLPDKSILISLIRHGSYILNINQPIEIMHKGMVDRTIYLVLEGKVEVVNDNNTKSEFGPGHIVGETSFFTPSGKRDTRAICPKGKLFIIKESGLRYLLSTKSLYRFALVQFIILSVIYKYGR